MTKNTHKHFKVADVQRDMDTTNPPPPQIYQVLANYKSMPPGTSAFLIWRDDGDAPMEIIAESPRDAALDFCEQRSPDWGDTPSATVFVEHISRGEKFTVELAPAWIWTVTRVASGIQKD